MLSCFLRDLWSCEVREQRQAIERVVWEIQADFLEVEGLEPATQRQDGVMELKGNRRKHLGESLLVSRQAQQENSPSSLLHMHTTPHNHTHRQTHLFIHTPYTVIYAPIYTYAPK